MKKVIMIMIISAMVTVSGCYTVQSNSPKGGSVLKGEGFKIAVPTFDVNIKQGEVQNVAISIERGEAFKQDVKLEIKAAKGISIEPTNVTVKAGDKPDVQLRVTIPKDAALGVYLVTVKGTPKTGGATSTEFSVEVVTP
ncbi:MAG: hypothetical protein WC770_08300 [Phycisphaerae bacterium]|jgi:uncharacterized membrane protein